MTLARLSFIFALQLMLAACATRTIEIQGAERVVYRDGPERIVYRDGPERVVIKEVVVSSANDCKAECRREHIDALDWCYRNPRNFVPNQDTESGRARYDRNVLSCLSTHAGGKFGKYTRGSDICSSICNK
jgi:hypothetical protein